MNTRPYWLDGYINLLAKILSVGVSNPDYFREAWGRYYCQIGGLDPEATYEKAKRLRQQQLLKCRDELGRFKENEADVSLDQTAPY